MTQLNIAILSPPSDPPKTLTTNKLTSDLSKFYQGRYDAADYNLFAVGFLFFYGILAPCCYYLCLND